ncbi:MAG: SDR family oxidoreductase [Micrococcales bacterium]|nr:SDR family oxidoreductase [Micrococcales bacterium]
MPGQFDGRVAMVTGGARGLGYAMAQSLASHGADIALADRLQSVTDAAQTLAQDSGRRVIGIPTDVTDEASVAAAFTRVADELGTARLLVNAAGVAMVEPALDVTAQQWRWLIDVNLTGTFLMCRDFARAAIAAGVEAAIVNVSSMSGFIVNVPQQQAAYNASKAGVSMLTKSLAIEWIDQGVRVNAIGPGYFASDMTKTVAEEQPDMAAFWNSRTPMGRMGQPEELGELIAYLLGDHSRYVVGQTILIDGGYTSV